MVSAEERVSLGAQFRSTQLGLVHRSPMVQQRLGVAGGLLTPLDDQVGCRLESAGLRQVRGHRRIVGVVGVLLVDDLGHALQRLAYPYLADDAMVQPIGQ